MPLIKRILFPVDFFHAYFGAARYEEEFAQSVSEQAKRRVEILQTTAGTAGPVFVNSVDPAKIVACAAKGLDADLLAKCRQALGDAEYLRHDANAI